MDGWDIALLAAAGYVAVVAMVRLMRNRRDELISELRQQAETERQRQQIEQERAEEESRHKKRAA